MPVTITIRHDVVREANDYALHRGTTLSRLIGDYVDRIAAASRRIRAAEAESAYAFLMQQDDGGVDANWHFSRDDANER